MFIHLKKHFLISNASENHSYVFFVIQLIIKQTVNILSKYFYKNLHPYNRPNKNNNTRKKNNNTHKIDKLLRNSVARFAFVYRDRDCGNFEGKTRGKHHQTRVYRKYCINQKLGKLGKLGTGARQIQSVA